MVLIALAQAATTFQGSTFYAGDPHAHSGWSLDGGASDVGSPCATTCGAWEDYFQTARDNGLDWVVNTDHVQGDPLPAASPEGFLESHLGALEADDPDNGFVTIPGAETWWTIDHRAVGHKTLMMFGDDDVLADLTEADLQPTGSPAYDIVGCNVIGEWMSAVTARFGDMLLIPHHPAMTLPMETDWSCFHPEWEPAVEIYSAHGSSVYRDALYDRPVSGFNPDTTAEAAIDPAGWGYKLGFLAGTDGHDTRPGSVCEQDGQHPDLPDEGGLTLVVLPEGQRFDRAAVREAILARHTWATSGVLTPAVVRYRSAGVEPVGVGDDVAWPEHQDVEVSVEVWPDDVAAVTAVDVVGDTRRWSMVGDGAGTWSVTIPYGEVPVYLYAEVELDGDVVYGEGGCDDEGSDDAEYLWSSPSWVTVVGSDLDEDGFTTQEGDCDDEDGAVNPAVDERWYDGVDADCDGASDYDADGDGYDSSAHGGIDCDDGDPARIWDCVGGWTGDVALPTVEDGPVEIVEPPGDDPGGCGCSTGTAPPAWLAGLGILAWVRRRTG